MSHCRKFVESSSPDRLYEDPTPFGKFNYPASKPKRFMLADKKKLVIFSGTERESQYSNCVAAFVEDSSVEREYHDARLFFTDDNVVAFAYLPIKSITSANGGKISFEGDFETVRAPLKREGT